MDFMKINLYGHPSGTVFEPQAVLEKVRERFPEMIVLPGDQLALSVDRATRLGAASAVVEKLRKNAQAYGPAFAFDIPIPGGGTVQGRARRYDVTFLFDANLPEDMRDLLVVCLQSLHKGPLEMGTTAKPQEILSKA